MSQTPESLPRMLEPFLDPFRAAFRRRDQARWAAVYLQGLLQTGGRKTIENLARNVEPLEHRRADVAQALQHFINQSPWDSGDVWRLYQRWLAGRLEVHGGLFVVDEFSLVKQGRHSVGVQRQYSAALGRKTNCQVVVGLFQAGPAGVWPLRLQLYLPRQWRDDARRLDEAGVPAAARTLPGRNEIALSLLDEARAAGVPGRALACGEAWGRSEELARAAGERDLEWSGAAPVDQRELLRRGRDALRNDRGLDHFEGRSWRGFHHHACLVALAQAFALTRCAGCCAPV